ncbi:hypothetical protein [Rhodohalobacter sp.]|uniref:hypothetical protein n=1 Tax=Rhodohalobacter sp. TaxID=1974210 RepID=UPI003565EB67
MKEIFTILFLLILPSLGLSQPMENETTADSPNFTKFDLIKPSYAVSAYNTDNSSPLNTIRNSPELAFISSAILPGSAQAVNGNWLRTGLFAAVEATAIILAVDYQNSAERKERSYERNADQNWSVVQYAQWLTEYHLVHNLSNPYISELRDDVAGLIPTFDTDIDWKAVDINLLRNAERSTRYITTDDQSANNFSHTLPAYGSQQYYELIAKYYQYQAGWRDYHDFHDQLGHTGNDFIQRYFFDRGGAYASPLFWQFAEDADRFNSLYRTGRTFQMLLIVNHVASAFDALFTVQLKQNRIEATSSIVPGRQLSMTVRF